MSAVAGMQTEGPQPEPEPKKKGPRIVDFDEQIQSEVAPTPGQSFFFGEVGVLKFADGTQYHIKKNRATISDPKLIENILKAAENPALKIFLD